MLQSERPGATAEASVRYRRSLGFLQVPSLAANDWFQNEAFAGIAAQPHGGSETKLSDAALFSNVRLLRRAKSGLILVWLLAHFYLLAVIVWCAQGSRRFALVQQRLHKGKI